MPSLLCRRAELAIQAVLLLGLTLQAVWGGA